jgi:hypothetical protein
MLPSGYGSFPSRDAVTANRCTGGLLSESVIETMRNPAVSDRGAIAGPPIRSAYCDRRYELRVSVELCLGNVPMPIRLPTQKRMAVPIPKVRSKATSMATSVP